MEDPISLQAYCTQYNVHPASKANRAEHKLLTPVAVYEARCGTLQFPNFDVRRVHFGCRYSHLLVSASGLSSYWGLWSSLAKYDVLACWGHDGWALLKRHPLAQFPRNCHPEHPSLSCHPLRFCTDRAVPKLN